MYSINTQAKTLTGCYANLNTYVIQIVPQYKTKLSSPGLTDDTGDLVQGLVVVPAAEFAVGGNITCSFILTNQNHKMSIWCEELVFRFFVVYVQVFSLSLLSNNNIFLNTKSVRDFFTPQVTQCFLRPDRRSKNKMFHIRPGNYSGRLVKIQ